MSFLSIKYLPCKYCYVFCKWHFDMDSITWLPASIYFCVKSIAGMILLETIHNHPKIYPIEKAWLERNSTQEGGSLSSECDHGKGQHPSALGTEGQIRLTAFVGLGKYCLLKVQRLLAVYIISQVFWDSTPYSLVDGYQSFAGIYCLQLQA
jgi:hypothetical protein